LRYLSIPTATASSIHVIATEGEQSRVLHGLSSPHAAQDTQVDVLVSQRQKMVDAIRQSDARGLEVSPGGLLQNQLI
jgi:adenosine/AMP kinase